MNINGTSGADSLVGTNSDDFIDGLDGNDTLYGGGGGNDTIKGGSGDDTLNSYAGTGTLYGGEGNDTLYLYSNATGGSLFGENGNDKIYVSAGSNVSLDGGAGNDELHLYDKAVNGTLTGGDGDDKIYISSGTGSVADGGAGNDELYLYDLAVTATLRGGAGDDKIYVSSGPGARLEGGDGNDTLSGGAGNDTIDGGTGDNVLYGGDGNDTYLIHSRTDYIYDSKGTDSGVVYVDFYKTSTAVESWTWAPGVQKLPYWIDALLPSGAPQYPVLPGAGKTLYFAFPTSAPSHFTGTDLTTFQAFTEAQKTLARQALSYISSVVDLNFVETSDAGGKNTIVFSNSEQSGSNGHAMYPSTSASGSDVAIKISSDNMAAKDGTYAALTLIHELGHALGLKHTFSHPDASGDVGEGPYLPSAEESTQWSVMSYTSSAAQYHLQYSPFDIAALQYLYGPSKAKTTNDTYVLSADNPNFIWDGGGIDTIDGSGLGQGMTLYLEPGYWGYVGSKSALASAAGQIQVNFGTTIENAVGTAFSDTITGNGADNSISGGAGNDTLVGGGGNDTLVGGSGTDTAAYTGARSTYVIKHTSTGFSVQDKTGAEGKDTLVAIEQAAFSDGAVSFDYNDVVQSLYVAYFGRAADANGLVNFEAQLAAIGGPRDAQSLATAYATNATIHALVDAFGASDESKALYSGDTRNFVTAIYNNVLNRGPDSAGLDFWANAIDHSGLTRGNASLSILAGALSNSSVQGLVDAALVKNKISVASNFTFALDTASKAAAYSGNTAAASVRAMLASVTETTDTDAFQTNVDNKLLSLVAANGQAAGMQAELVGIHPDLATTV